MPAGNLKLTIEQGAKFYQKFTWRDSKGAVVNLTDYTALLQIRKDKEDKEWLIELKDTAGITLGGEAGTVELRINSADTTSVSWMKAVYDLKLTDPAGEAIRLLEGEVEVSYQVSKVDD